MNKFSERLAELMKEDEISQSQLAKELSIKQQSVSRYLKGEREPNIDTLIAIAKFFGITLDDLLL